MKKKKIIKIALLVGFACVIIGGSFAYYLFNKPHRDVQAAKIDFTLTSSDLVAEYLAQPELANEKYLSEEGDSKILSVSGKVHSISLDLNNQQVVLLREQGDKAGVSCTFTATTNAHASQLKVGQTVTVKGVIRSGAGYDKDLELYEDVILEKCDVIN